MGIFDGFNPSGQGTMFGGNQTNSSTSFYDFLGNKKGLTEECMFDLTGDLGNKEKAPELIKAFLEYQGEKPEQNKIDQMMGNSGFIMGLSLMQQAAGGKNLGAALLPAAETTQGFITNQELRDQNKKLMRVKETGQIVELIKTTSDLQTAEAGRAQTAATTANIKSETVLNNLRQPLLENQDVQGKQTITLNGLTIEDRQSDALTKVATLNSIDKNDTLSESQKIYYMNNTALYGSIDESLAYNPSSATTAKVEKLVGSKFIEDLVEKIPGFDSTKKDELRNQIKDDVGKKATQLALLEFNNGNRKTKDVTAKDVDAAYKEMVTDGTIQERGWWMSLIGGRVFGGGITLGKRMGGEVQAGIPTIIGEDGPEVFVPETDGNIISNPKTAGGYTWEDAIIDSSEMLKKIKQSSGAEEAKKALKKFRPDLYI